MSDESELTKGDGDNLSLEQSYGLRTERHPLPERLAGLESEGYRWTGWVHEASPPFRVIVFDDESVAGQWVGAVSGTVEVFDGSEDSVSYRLAWPGFDGPETSPDAQRMVHGVVVPSDAEIAAAEEATLHDPSPFDERDPDDDEPDFPVIGRDFDAPDGEQSG